MFNQKEIDKQSKRCIGVSKRLIAKFTMVIETIKPVEFDNSNASIRFKNLSRVGE